MALNSKLLMWDTHCLRKLVKKVIQNWKFQNKTSKPPVCVAMDNLEERKKNPTCLDFEGQMKNRMQ